MTPALQTQNKYIDNENKSMDNELLRNLQIWSFEFKINHNAINALMEILRHAFHYSKL